MDNNDGGTLRENGKPSPAFGHETDRRDAGDLARKVVLGTSPFTGMIPVVKSRNVAALAVDLASVDAVPTEAPCREGASSTESEPAELPELANDAHANVSLGNAVEGLDAVDSGTDVGDGVGKLEIDDLVGESGTMPTVEIAAEGAVADEGSGQTNELHDDAANTTADCKPGESAMDEHAEDDIVDNESQLAPDAHFEVASELEPEHIGLAQSGEVPAFEALGDDSFEDGYEDVDLTGATMGAGPLTAQQIAAGVSAELPAEDPADTGELVETPIFAEIYIDSPEPDGDTGPIEVIETPVLSGDDATLTIATPMVAPPPTAAIPIPIVAPPASSPTTAIPIPMQATASSEATASSVPEASTSSPPTMAIAIPKASSDAAPTAMPTSMPAEVSPPTTAIALPAAQLANGRVDDHTLDEDASEIGRLWTATPTGTIAIGASLDIGTGSYRHSMFDEPLDYRRQTANLAEFGEMPFGGDTAPAAEAVTEPLPEDDAPLALDESPSGPDTLALASVAVPRAPGNREQVGIHADVEADPAHTDGKADPAHADVEADRADTDSRADPAAVGAALVPVSVPGLSDGVKPRRRWPMILTGLMTVSLVVSTGVLAGIAYNTPQDQLPLIGQGTRSLVEPTAKPTKSANPTPSTRPTTAAPTEEPPAEPESDVIAAEPGATASPSPSSRPSSSRTQTTTPANPGSPAQPAPGGESTIVVVPNPPVTQAPAPPPKDIGRLVMSGSRSGETVSVTVWLDAGGDKVSGAAVSLSSGSSSTSCVTNGAGHCSVSLTVGPDAVTVSGSAAGTSKYTASRNSITV